MPISETQAVLGLVVGRAVGGKNKTSQVAQCQNSMCLLQRGVLSSKLIILIAQEEGLLFSKACLLHRREFLLTLFTFLMEKLKTDMWLCHSNDTDPEILRVCQNLF